MVLLPTLYRFALLDARKNRSSKLGKQLEPRKDNRHPMNLREGYGMPGYPGHIQRVGSQVKELAMTSTQTEDATSS